MKRIPSMTNIPRNEESFRDILVYINENAGPEDFIQWLINTYEYSKYGAEKIRASLLKFGFINKDDDGKLLLSEPAEELVDNKIQFEDFMYEILTSCRFEVMEFIQDIIGIIESGNNLLPKKELIDRLEAAGYAAYIRENKINSIKRNLYDLMKRTQQAGIITESEDGNSYILGKKASSYGKDSREKDFFSEIQRKVRSFIFKDNILTDREWLRLHRLYLRSRAIGGLRGLETQISQVQKHLLPKLNDEIEKYKKSKIKPQRRLSKKTLKKSLWEFREGVSPYEWQKKCLEEWMNKGKHGVVEAVTGTGKTMLAFMAIEAVLSDHKDSIISIIVPTKALMYQWKQSLIKDFQVAEKDVGLRGDGNRDSFFDGKKVIIYIYNSAVIDDNLVNDVNRFPEKKHFLVVDECHRSGSPEFRKIFDARYDYNLGLSATPEKPTDDNFKQYIEPNLGSIIFRYTFKDARKDGVIPPFEIHNIAIELTPDERRKYDEQTDVIRKTVKNIKMKYYERFQGLSEDLFEAMLRKIQSEADKPDPDISRYFSVTSERKRNLYYAEKRWEFVKKLVKEHGNKKIILFHESIAAVDWKIYGDSDWSTKNILLYHSGLTPVDNKISLYLYRKVDDAILVSVKALIEGLDVPDTDIGIIIASSSSPTQRIQSMGRILRQTQKKKATNAVSKLFVIYANKTTDERIFPRIDWATVIDKEPTFRIWDIENNKEKYEDIDPPSPPIKLPGCDEIDVSSLSILDEYPGAYDGMRFSCDHRGKPFKKSKNGRKYLEGKEWEEIAKNVQKIKPGGGVFMINNCGHILIKQQVGEKLKTIYLGETDILTKMQGGTGDEQ